jgi:ATP-dependent RNA helicase DeaD
MSKEEVIKHFVSTEFNHFIEYYERAGDLNASASKGDDRDDRGPRRRERGNDTESGKTRFFVSIGRRDGLNPGGLLRLICDATGLNSGNVGRIDIMTSYSFFEADNEYADNIINKVNGSDYEGHSVSVEVTKAKSGGGSGHRGGGGGGRRDGGSFGGKFQGNRDGGRREGGFGGNRDGGSRDGGNRDGGRREGGSGFGGGSRRDSAPRSEGSGRRDGGFGGGRDGGSRDGGSRDGGRREGASSGGGSRPRSFGKPFNKK